MNKCPRCENENLKEEYKYCPVCGLDLKVLKMDKNEVINTIKDLMKSRSRLFTDERVALEYAIRELERTALEVAVQEQFIEPIENTIWIEKLANTISQCVTNRDTPLKE